jgi:hypothetical protein
VLETIEKTTRRTELKVEALKAKQAQLYNRMLSVVRSVEVRVCCGCRCRCRYTAMGLIGCRITRFSVSLYLSFFGRACACVVLGAALPGRSVAGHRKEVRGRR